MYKQRVYLDHNATSPLKPEVKDSMISVMDAPGNPSAIHKYGRDARGRVEMARLHVGQMLNIDPMGVIFTSGATEANNLALNLPLAERFLVSAVEHPAVLKAREDIEIIPVTTDGIIDLKALETLLQESKKPTLVSVMMVNNETGIIQPIQEITQLVHKYNGFVHTDAVQAIGRIPVDMCALKVDLMSLSGHKIGGPQGMGALVFTNCVEPHPILKGGGQEKQRRAGTENLTGIVGLGKACECAVQSLEDYQKLKIWRDYIESEVKDIHPETIFFGQNVERVTNTSLFSIPGLSSETLVISLDIEGVAVSNGSACSSGKITPSHVLKAMGASDEEALGAVRVSLGWNTTEDDVTAFIKTFKKIFNRVKSRISTENAA